MPNVYEQSADLKKSFCPLINRICIGDACVGFSRQVRYKYINGESVIHTYYTCTWGIKEGEID